MNGQAQRTFFGVGGQAGGPRRVQQLGLKLSGASSGCRGAGRCMDLRFLLSACQATSHPSTQNSRCAPVHEQLPSWTCNHSVQPKILIIPCQDSTVQEVLL